MYRYSKLQASSRNIYVRLQKEVIARIGNFDNNEDNQHHQQQYDFVLGDDDSCSTGTFGKNKCYSVTLSSCGSVTTFDVTCHDSEKAAKCIKAPGCKWYGGAEMLTPQWPIVDDIEQQPYLILDFLDTSTPGVKFGSVLESYWLNSSGLAVIVEPSVPIKVGFSSGGLVLSSDYINPLNMDNSSKKDLEFILIISNDMVTTHRFVINRILGKPENIPDELMFRYPIWSTWARFHTDITQEKILSFAKEIKNNGFPSCQLEIDDMYSTKYGDFDFDPTKFPDPAGMLKQLHEMEYRVTAWAIPFANPDSCAFKEGFETGYFIMDSDGNPKMIRWWQGSGCALDPTNPDAVKWFVERLQRLKDMGVDSFKFDAGEINWLMPGTFKTMKPLLNPNQYATKYANAVTKAFGRQIEVRIGFRTQRLPVFVRILDVNSHWDLCNGIKSIIPRTLQMSLVGYPFVLPDMIGGNCYDRFPERELFIRWTQLTAFLPAMQFSIAPWQYDQYTRDLCLKFVKLHEEFVSPLIIKYARDCVSTGDPVIRPLWWIDDAPECLKCNQQFLIGDEILVCPVVDQGVKSIDFYLPKSDWLDLTHSPDNQQVYTGARWIRNYPVTLDFIPYFAKSGC